MFQTFLKCVRKPRRRKQWLREISQQIINDIAETEKRDKYPLPTDKWILNDVLIDPMKRNLYVQGCYAFTSTSNDNLIFLSDYIFPFRELTHNDFIRYISNLVLVKIFSYITACDENIATFIDSLSLIEWKLVLYVILTSPISNSSGDKLLSKNYIYLDEDDYYVIECVFENKIKTTFVIHFLLRNLINMLQNFMNNYSIHKAGILHNIFIQFHQESFKKHADFKEMVFSLRFYVSKDFLIKNKTITYAKDIGEKILDKEIHKKNILC